VFKELFTAETGEYAEKNLFSFHFFCKTVAFTLNALEMILILSPGNIFSRHFSACSACSAVKALNFYSIKNESLGDEFLLVYNSDIYHPNYLLKWVSTRNMMILIGFITYSVTGQPTNQPCLLSVPRLHNSQQQPFFGNTMIHLVMEVEKF
jgi:hypothetical protein